MVHSEPFTENVILGPDCDPPSYHEVTMETRAPIQSDSDTLRDGIENESFDRNNSNAEMDSTSQSTNQSSPAEQPNQSTSHESEHVPERSDNSEDEQASRTSDSTSTESNDPKTTIEVTTINIPVQDPEVNQGQNDTDTEHTENASTV